jgi:molybdopterin biosynthesis enzyme
LETVSPLDARAVPLAVAIDCFAAQDYFARLPRPHYIRVRLQHGKSTPIGRQESHALFGLSQANALLRVAVGQSLIVTSGLGWAQRERGSIEEIRAGRRRLVCA